jgi:hypothetical protein
VKPKDGHGGPTPSDLHASEAAFEDARQQGATLQGLPEIDFATFVLSLSHSAYVHLGDAPDPSDGKQQVDLPMARQTIELLALLQDKTRNNLTGDEERVLEQGLYDLRMRYVEVSKRQ